MFCTIRFAISSFILLLAVASLAESGRHARRFSIGGRRYMVDAGHEKSWYDANKRCRRYGADFHSLFFTSEREILDFAEREFSDETWTNCYWTGGFFTGRQFAWLGGFEDAALNHVIGRHLAVSGRPSRWRRCLCLRVISEYRYRFIMTDCRHKQPIVCKQATLNGIRPRQFPSTTTNAPTTAKKMTSRKPLIINDEDSDKEEQDEDEVPFDSEPLDHAKFHLPSDVEGDGIVDTTTTANLSSKTTTAPRTTDLPLREAQLELVTLLVLYTVIIVSSLVFSILCVLHCCRSRKRSVHYVRQVDTDDIPRFMPTSWTA